MFWRTIGGAAILALVATACGATTGEVVVTGDRDERTEVEQPPTPTPATSDEPPPAETPEPTSSPPPTTPAACPTVVPSADLLAAPLPEVDQMRAQLPLMLELHQDTVLLEDRFGIQPDHMMVGGLPNILIGQDDADGRCAEIIGAVARPDLVTFVEWSEGDYADATIRRADFPPWRQLIESDVGFQRDGLDAERLWISIGTGRHGVTNLGLRHDQEDLAATLLDRYGELIEIDVGNFAFPPERVEPGERERCGSLRSGTATDSVEVRTMALRGDVFTGTVEVVVANTGTSTVHVLPARIAELAAPGTDELVSAFTGVITAEARPSVPVGPGGEITLIATPSTASCDLDVGYALPAGRYELVLPIQVFESPASEPDESEQVLVARLEIELP